MQNFFDFQPRRVSIFDYIDEDDPVFTYTEDFDATTSGSSKMTVTLPAPPCSVYAPTDGAIEMLQQMTGVDQLKDHARRLLNMHAYNQKIMALGKKPHSMNLHSIYSGGVGTGKTTAAVLTASILKEAGVLSRGHLVSVDRTTFSGKNYGVAEQNLRIVVAAAQGGVLFFDEAYLLQGVSRDDCMRNILPMLLEILADESRRDFCVVLAGYPREMENLLSENKGLSSRFVNRFTFPSFTKEQLLEITRHRLEAFDYEMTPEAWTKYGALVERTMAECDRSFGNGRWVANTLEDVYLQHALRCVDDVECKDPLALGSSESILNLITAADIPEYRPSRKRKLGY